MMKTLKYIFLFSLIHIYPLLACPNCKDAYSAGTTQAAIGEGYSMSVLFMLSMLLLAISIVVGRIVYAIRKKNRNQILA